MKSKTSLKSLKLNPERLRSLTDRQLLGILGGDSNAGNGGPQKSGLSLKATQCFAGRSA